MKITGICVSVGYSSYLEHCLRTLRTDTEWVVTTPNDPPTIDIVRDSHSIPYITEAFYRDGAHFNKGRALNEVIDIVRSTMSTDWILVHDADICLPPYWRNKLPSVMDPTVLYGCKRLQADTPDHLYDPFRPLIHDDRVGYGYFQLFHSSAISHLSTVFSTDWSHAGGYDSDFLRMWSKVVELPFKAWHLGELHNWYGIGNEAKYNELMRLRAIAGGIHPTEKLSNSLKRG